MQTVLTQWAQAHALALLALACIAACVAPVIGAAINAGADLRARSPMRDRAR